MLRTQLLLRFRELYRMLTCLLLSVDYRSTIVITCCLVIYVIGDPYHLFDDINIHPGEHEYHQLRINYNEGSINNYKQNIRDVRILSSPFTTTVASSLYGLIQLV